LAWQVKFQLHPPVAGTLVVPNDTEINQAVIGDAAPRVPQPEARRLQVQPKGTREMAAKKGIGSYSAEDPESGPVGGKGEVNLGEHMGSNKPSKGAKDEMADPDRIQRDLDRYREELAEDAPDSGSPEDQL
jgi:hypothetical protein